MTDLPDHVSAEEIESFLDRTALEIEEGGAVCLLPIFQWLEQQLARKLEMDRAMAAVRDRVSSMKNKSRLGWTGEVRT